MPACKCINLEMLFWIFNDGSVCIADAPPDGQKWRMFLNDDSYRPCNNAKKVHLMVTAHNNVTEYLASFVTQIVIKSSFVGLRSFVRRRENFSTTRKIVRRRENFGNVRSGRCDRFRSKILKLGAILAIFWRFPAGNVLLGTQGISCLEHRGCPTGNSGNVLLGTQGMSCLENKECLAWSTMNLLLRTQN